MTLLIQIIFGIIKILIKLYFALVRGCGFFVGTAIYLVLFYIGFAFVIHYVEEIAGSSPYKGLTLFHSLKKSEQKELVEMATLCSAAYKDGAYSVLSSKRAAESGFNEIGQYESGYKQKYTVFQRDRDIYIVFHGAKNEADFQTVARIIDSNTSDLDCRFNGASKTVQEWIKNANGHNIYLVGHSLGGAMVQYCLQTIGSGITKAYTINPFGLPAESKREPTVDSRLTDVIHEADVAQAAGNNARRLGARRIMVRGVFHKDGDTWVPDFGITSVFSQHGIKETLENMRNQYAGSYYPPSVSETRTKRQKMEDEAPSMRDLLGDP